MSTQVWKLRCDVRRYSTALLLDEEDNRRATEFDGRSHVDGWRPILTAVSQEGEIGDFLYLFPTLFGVGKEASRVLSPLVGRELELLPAKDTTGDIAALLNFTNVVDALDEPASELRRFSSGRLMQVTKYVFRPDLVGGAHVFRVPQLFTVIFATVRFKELVADAGLTGLLFEQL
jgi:hypothetical protein